VISDVTVMNPEGECLRVLISQSFLTIFSLMILIFTYLPVDFIATASHPSLRVPSVGIPCYAQCKQTLIPLS